MANRDANGNEYRYEVVVTFENGIEQTYARTFTLAGALSSVESTGRTRGLLKVEITSI